MAHRIEQQLRCDMCGTAQWEWDPAQGGSRFAYEPEDEFCPGCNMRHNASEDKKSLPGTTVRLVKKTAQQKAQEWVVRRERRKRDKADRMAEDS